MATAFVIKAQEELDNAREYLAKHPASDAITATFYEEEIERLTANLNTALAQPCKMIIATARATGREGEEVERYLGFGAAVNLVLAARSKTIFIIDVPAQHAEWQSMRLASGLLGGHIYDSCAEALAVARQLQEIA